MKNNVKTIDVCTPSISTTRMALKTPASVLGNGRNQLNRNKIDITKSISSRNPSKFMSSRSSRNIDNSNVTARYLNIMQSLANNKNKSEK